MSLLVKLDPIICLYSNYVECIECKCTLQPAIISTTNGVFVREIARKRRAFYPGARNFDTTGKTVWSDRRLCYSYRGNVHACSSEIR